MTSFVLCAYAAFILALLFAAGAALTPKRLRASPAGWSAAGLGAVGAAAGLCLLAAPLGAPGATVVGLASIVAACAVLVATRSWRMWRPALPPILSVFGVLALSLGLSGATGNESPFGWAATRFLPWALPEDNRIPALLATWLTSDASSSFLIGDWLPSDRPPLQSGVILLVRAAVWPMQMLGMGPGPDEVDFAASVGAQLVWIPAAAGLVRAIGLGARQAYASVAFAAVVPVMLVNTIYTWPKLLAAGMVVGAIALLVTALRGQVDRAGALVLAATLTAFGLLSHGGAAFMLPLVGVLAVWLLVVMRSARERVTAALAAGAAAVLVYLPWILFQRVVAPPGDRLLKWHLAGVIAVDDRSFLRALIDQYSSKSLSELIAARVANLGHAFDLGLLRGIGTLFQSTDDRWTAEFYETPIALGAGVIAILALLATVAVTAIRRGTLAAQDRWSAAIVAGTVGCILIWSLAMFQPGGAIVHQGSHAWVVILLVIPFAWLVERAARAAVVVGVAQIALTVALVRESPLVPGLGTAPVLTAAGVVVLVGSVLLSRRRVRVRVESEDPANPARPRGLS